MAVEAYNLNDRQRAERKLLITVAEWKDENGSITIGTGSDAYKVEREILGTRTPDSSIEYNTDIETSTDIRGINYTDANKTQPQQTLDPYTVLGGSTLGPVLNDIRRRNALSEYNDFTVYVITAYIGSSTNGYACEKHSGCTIIPTALGGENFVNMPIEVHFSNDCDGTGKPAIGTVDTLSKNFVFTPASVG